MRALLASPLGFVIGVSLGAVGGGGSVLAVPALAYVAGQPAPDAITTSLLVVGAAAVAGLVQHAREQRVRPGVGLAFAATGAGGAVAGSVLSRGTDPDVVLLAFSGLMVVAAVTMARRRVPEPPAAPVPPATPAPVPVAPSAPVAPGVATSEPRIDGRGTGALIDWRDPLLVARMVACGAAVGLVTGFFGVGGGFVIVPALVICMGFSMPEAAATSLLVIASNTGVSLLARVGTGTLDWHVAVPFTVAAMVGSAAGSRLAGRIDHDRLVRAFVILLLAVAAYTALRSGSALA